MFLQILLLILIVCLVIQYAGALVESMDVGNVFLAAASGFVVLGLMEYYPCTSDKCTSTYKQDLKSARNAVSQGAAAGATGATGATESAIEVSNLPIDRSSGEQHRPYSTNSKNLPGYNVELVNSESADGRETGDLEKSHPKESKSGERWENDIEQALMRTPVVIDGSKMDLRKQYNNMGASGDNLIASRMQYLSTMNKRAMDIRSRYDKYSALHLFDEELRDNEYRDWWDNQDYELMF